MAKKAIEALFLVVLAIAAIYFIAGSVTRENQQPSGDGQPGGTFKVEVLSLSVSPQQPMVGQRIEVVAVLRNTGEVSGTYQAQLKVDGEVKYTIPVNLQPGETKSAQFTGAIETPGDHVIQVGEKSVVITVLAPPGGASETWRAMIQAPA